VDHLANDIEQIWQEQSNLSFDDAKTISFKKFGVFGFMEVVEARQNALFNKYWKLVWGIFKNYFKIPQIISTLTLFTAIFSSFLIIPNQKWVYMILGFGVCAVLIIRLVHLHRIKKLRLKTTNKKWLLEESILNAGNVGAFGYLVFQIPVRFAQIESTPLILAVSIFFTSYVMIPYIITFVVPSQIEEILIKQYPEYKLV